MTNWLAHCKGDATILIEGGHPIVERHVLQPQAQFPKHKHPHSCIPGIMHQVHHIAVTRVTRILLSRTMT